THDEAYFDQFVSWFLKSGLISSIQLECAYFLLSIFWVAEACDDEKEDNNAEVEADPENTPETNPETTPETNSGTGQVGGGEGNVDEGDFEPSKIFYDEQGHLTNGRYTINDSGMLPHKNGTMGKSQFLSDVDAEKAVLDAAEYADKYNLWETNTGNPNDFACKAKVYVENGPVGITGDGKLTNYINVYRTKTGQVHGCPGN
ncbi:MAG: hypothetical protein IIY49_09555, partial [Eubacterium sp.]|nr:hypothetical protein [Eubacterium sp.]